MALAETRESSFLCVMEEGSDVEVYRLHRWLLMSWFPTQSRVSQSFGFIQTQFADSSRSARRRTFRRIFPCKAVGTYCWASNGAWKGKHFQISHRERLLISPKRFDKTRKKETLGGMKYSQNLNMWRCIFIDCERGTMKALRSEWKLSKGRWIHGSGAVFPAEPFPCHARKAKVNGVLRRLMECSGYPLFGVALTVWGGITALGLKNE